MSWEKAKEEKVVKNIFEVKKEGKRVIIMGEIKRMLRGKDHSLTL